MNESKLMSTKRRMTALPSRKGKSKGTKTSIYVKLAFCVVLALIVTNFFSQTMEISTKKQYLSQLEEEILVQGLLNDEMEWIAQNSDDPSNYERIARSDLGLVKPDERVFVFVGDDE